MLFRMVNVLDKALPVNIIDDDSDVKNPVNQT